MSSENKVLESIKTRRSIRKYKPDMVPKQIIDRNLCGHRNEPPVSHNHCCDE